MPSCASCGQSMPSDARFCPSCGTSAVGGRVAPEERRVVTVLFADLVGYTSLAERRDPEHVKRLIESCFERLVVDIEDFGGRVDKLLGDAIVALFGAPVAHEDDAERAVRAALRMQRTLDRVLEERAGVTIDIKMRIGINTGEVLVGTLAGSDYTAMGDVVNTASRLQALAPPGGVLIGNATSVLCSPAITTEPFGITQLRGREQIEQSWLVTGAIGAGTRPVRSDVPFVGRTAERALIDAAVHIVHAGHGGVVSIVGEAGVGKTRLADEIVEGLEVEAIVVRTACAPYGELNPWSPIVTGVTGLFGFDRDAPPDVVRTVVEEKAFEVWGLASGDEALERYLDVVFHLLGHPSQLDRLDAAGTRDLVAAVVIEMLSGHAGRRVTAVVVDDLQWADPLLRDLLGVVVRSLGALPFLLVTTQRPDPDLVWPPQVDRPLVLQLPLGPLAHHEALDLVCSVLDSNGAADHDDEMVAALVDRGGGNPLFLVELAALAACRPDGSDLPGSLRALIAARIDQLPPAQRAILDNAAVLGHREAIGSLARFAKEMGQDFLRSDLDELTATGLLELDGRWWRFRSDVVREVAYQTLTKRVRAQRHAGVAAVLAARGQSIDDVAHHAATAAELFLELGSVDGIKGSIVEHAIEALREASVAALDTGRYEAAVRHTSRALDLQRVDEKTERRLLLVRATAEIEQRHFAAATADAQAVLDASVADGDAVNEAEARRRLGTVAQLQGDLVTARRELDSAVETFRRLGDDHGLANALRSRGFAEAFGGSLLDARLYLDQAMTLFKQLDDERGHAWTHQNLAWVAFQAGDFAAAEVQLAEARERFDELGDHTGVAWAAGLQAWVWYFQRRFDQAEELAVQVEANARRWADRWPMLMMQTLLANLRLWTGRLAEAEQIAERALAGFRDLGDRYGVMQALAPLTRARAALGKHAEAKRGLEESIALGESFGELTMARQGAAGVTMHLGLGDLTRHLAEQIVELNLASGTAINEASVLLALGRLQTGDADGAMAAIEELVVEDFPFGRATRALVRAVIGDVDGALEDAALVDQERGASYFDMGLARLAAVLANKAAGTDAAESLARFSSLASAGGDVGVVAVAPRRAERPDGEPGEESLAVAPGWNSIVDAVARPSRKTA